MPRKGLLAVGFGKLKRRAWRLLLSRTMEDLRVRSEVWKCVCMCGRERRKAERDTHIITALIIKKTI